ncbi:MAG: tRNA (guanosine(37)-N1)-methyltransferase TrmD [Thermomicrobiales bacterium]
MPTDREPRSAEPPLRFDVFTLFPEMFRGPLDESIVKRAQARGLVEIAIHDIRDWTHDRHRTADDTPYGGGPGMVMKAPPIVDAVEAVLGRDLPSALICLMSASGRRFDQRTAKRMSGESRIAIICGHYEGIDDRVARILGCQETSIGDFVLTGGELPAMAIIDAVTRLLPGAIDPQSIAEESFEDDLLEYPHFTRPASFRGHDVPDVLLSGHHGRVQAWRREQALHRTRQNRLGDPVESDGADPREDR